MLNKFDKQNEALNVLRHIKHGTVRGSRDVAINAINYLITRYSRNRIISGPFSGVVRGNGSIHGAAMAKLLGTYECELHNIMNKLSGYEWRKIINVGAGDGYYVIGTASKWKVDKVISYEMLSRGRDIIAESATINHIKNINNLGACEEKNLFENAEADSFDLLIMDVEGAELKLLSERVIERLKNSVLIIEAHDFVYPGCTEEIIHRLHRHHRVKIISSRERKANEFPLHLPVPKYFKKVLMCEGRPEVMNWVVAAPRCTADGKFSPIFDRCM